MSEQGQHKQQVLFSICWSWYYFKSHRFYQYHLYILLQPLFNILEITWGKNILYSKPSQKLRLVVVIKNLEAEIIQPWPKPSRMLYFSCYIYIYSNLKTLEQFYLGLLRSFWKFPVYMCKSESFARKGAMKNVRIGGFHMTSLKFKLENY